MDVAVYVAPVAVGMLMNNRCLLVSLRDRTRRAQEAGNIHHAKDNQHQSDGQLHGEPDPCGNHDIEENDDSADGEDGESVADAPEDAGHRRLQKIALVADDRSHCNDVVGIGGVADSEKKSHRDNREKADHRARSLDLDCSRRAQLVKAGGEKIKILTHLLSCFGGLHHLKSTFTKLYSRLTDFLQDSSQATLKLFVLLL